MNPTSYFYLATPYSKWPEGLDSAFEMACREAAKLMRVGIPVFSPIAHSHPVAKLGGIDPRDHDFWMEADAPMMQGAMGLIVVCAQGWKESIGMKMEIDAFKEAGKPILFLEPST